VLAITIAACKQHSYECIMMHVISYTSGTIV
jgi:hypothetical protein